MTEVDNLVSHRGTKQTKQTPQEAWMELLHASVDTAPTAIRGHLQSMVQLDNVPRKEKQFRNFASNSLNLRGGGGGNHATKILDAIWNHLNAQREVLKAAKEKADQAKQQAKEKQETKKLDKEEEAQQSAAASDEELTTKEATAPSSSSSSKVSDTDHHITDDKVLYKSVKKATKKLLKKAKGHKMKYKSLQKTLRTDLKVDKKKLQAAMEQVVAKEAKKFQLEGKEIKLIVT